MLGALTDAETDDVLRRQHIGRLGVAGENAVYIFPVAYGYRGTYVYFVSHEGLKVQLMRSHPHGCFQVDEIVSPAEWRSVMLHGTFEELSEEQDRDEGMSAIVEQEDSHAPPSFAPYVDGPDAMVVYRLNIEERTGRFERSQALAL